MLGTIAIRLLSLAFGYAFKGHKLASLRRVSMLRELSATLWFSLTGSTWFLWSFYTHLSFYNRSCLQGFNINFLLVGAYTLVLFGQSACVILCMPCILYIERKMQVCKEASAEGSVSEQVSTQRHNEIFNRLRGVLMKLKVTGFLPAIKNTNVFS